MESGTRSRRTASSQRLGKKKRIITGWVPEDAEDYEFPDETTWKRLEEKLCATLSPTLRGQLAGLSSMYAGGNPGARPHTTVIELVPELDDWKRKTERFRRHIWNSKQGRPSRKKLTRESVLEFFSSGHQRTPGYSSHPLALLAFALDAALVATEYVRQRICSPDYPGTRDDDLWFVWVGLVITMLRENGIRISRSTPQHDDELTATFIDFVEALQETLPLECRRRKDRESLIKGIKKAHRLCGLGDLTNLVTLMVGWGLIGDPEFGRLEGETRSPTVIRQWMFRSGYELRKRKIKQKSKRRNPIGSKN